MKLIVTGTGRCGTGYVAKAITALGLPCGHESVFTPYGVKSGMDADSSWMAVPSLGQFPEAVKVHLIRNPFLVVDSMFAVPGAFGNDLSVYGAFLHNHCTLDSLVDKRDQVLEFWIQWTARCTEECLLEWHVEDLSYGFLVNFLFGLGIRAGHCRPAFDSVSKTYNSRERPTVNWSSCTRWAEFCFIAKEYGYDAPRS